MGNEAIWALTSYCVSSILMTVFNKFVLSSHNFRMNFFLLLIQVWKLILIIVYGFNWTIVWIQKNWPTTI
jgi:hypothetical protein